MVSTSGEVVQNMIESKPSFEPSRNNMKPGAIGGIVLVILGIITLGLQFLAPNFFTQPIELGATIGATVMYAGSLAFFAVLLLNPGKHWWAVFPAFPLAAVGTTVWVEASTGLTGMYAGPIVLGGTSLTFFAILLLRRDHYWPMIPGGILASLAWMVRDPYSVGASLFLGIALAFVATCAVSLFMRRKAYWALIPAAIFGFVGLGVMDLNTLNWFGPSLLIILGAVLLFRRIRQ